MSLPRLVVDTNVLLVASAAHSASPLAENATPVEDPAFRKKVLDWLEVFESSESLMVLDWGWEIVNEYRGDGRRHKLTDQDYGMLVALRKFSTGRFHGVLLEWDEPGSAAVPDPALSEVVTDHADRKMVAAVLLAGGRGENCSLVNACDTDWYDWEQALLDAGVDVIQLIGDEWCHPKWLEKQSR